MQWFVLGGLVVTDTGWGIASKHTFCLFVIVSVVLRKLWLCPSHTTVALWLLRDVWSQKIKFRSGHFGRCPRVLCHGQAVLPMGRADVACQDGVYVYCPVCGDIYLPKSQRAACTLRELGAGIVPSVVGRGWVGHCFVSHVCGVA